MILPIPPSPHNETQSPSSSRYEPEEFEEADVISEGDHLELQLSHGGSSSINISTSYEDFLSLANGYIGDNESSFGGETNLSSETHSQHDVFQDCDTLENEENENGALYVEQTESPGDIYNIPEGFL